MATFQAVLSSVALSFPLLTHMGKFLGGSYQIVDELLLHSLFNCDYCTTERWEGATVPFSALVEVSNRVDWDARSCCRAGLSFPLKRPYIDMSGLTLPLVHLLENLREPTGTELERETSLV